MNYKIRKIKSDEYKILDDFLYEAIFIPKGIEPPPKSIIKKPELQVYVENFGKKDDCCLVAEKNGKTRLCHLILATTRSRIIKTAILRDFFIYPRYMST